MPLQPHKYFLLFRSELTLHIKKRHQRNTNETTTTTIICIIYYQGLITFTNKCFLPFSTNKNIFFFAMTRICSNNLQMMQTQLPVWLTSQPTVIDYRPSAVAGLTPEVGEFSVCHHLLFLICFLPLKPQSQKEETTFRLISNSSHMMI